MSYRFTKLIDLNDDNDLIEESPKLTATTKQQLKANTKKGSSTKYLNDNELKSTTSTINQQQSMNQTKERLSTTVNNRLINRIQKSDLDDLSTTTDDLTNSNLIESKTVDDTTISLISSSSIFCFISYLLTVFIFFIILIIILICIAFIFLSYR